LPTYLYFCDVHKEIEIFHPINETIDECPKCKEDKLQPMKLKRLIAGSSFILLGSGWHKDLYSK
jgi:predicted nucleic acid-binding Zn ribbon protein